MLEIVCRDRLMRSKSVLPPQHVLVVLAVLLAVAASGCGSTKFAPVSGRVTLNGQPVEGIFVYFSPVPGKDPMNVGLPSHGKTSSDGRFNLLVMDAQRERGGALIGTHTVTLDDERTFGGLKSKSRVPAG